MKFLSSVRLGAYRDGLLFGPLFYACTIEKFSLGAPSHYPWLSHNFYERNFQSKSKSFTVLLCGNFTSGDIKGILLQKRMKISITALFILASNKLPKCPTNENRIKISSIAY